MTPPVRLTPAVICAENVALSHFLHNVPVQPSAIDVHQMIDESHSRAMTLDQERQLTNVLAVLSAPEEDINRVTAVAVREQRKPRHLEILIAVNRAEHSSAGQYLQGIKAAFDKIFAVLSRAKDEYDQALEDDTFAQVLVACKDRIRSRLRFIRHKRGKVKTPLSERLQALAEAVSQLPDPEARLLVAATRKLIQALEAYKNHQVARELKIVVQEAHNWICLGDLRHLLTPVPPRVFDKRQYTELRDIIRKVGQYRTAAQRLYRLARELQILRKTMVTTVRLPREAFNRQRPQRYEPQLATAFQRICRCTDTLNPLPDLCRYVGKSEEEAQQGYCAMVLQILGSSKIHAEIQILAHMKTTHFEDSGVPRIVQSNKKACFLCNEAFKLYREPVMPKSHGKLYAAWRLPMLAGLKDLQGRLNSSLEERARRSIDLVIQKRQKIDYHDPYESSALSMSVLESKPPSHGPGAVEHEPREGEAAPVAIVREEGDESKHPEAVASVLEVSQDLHCDDHTAALPAVALEDETVSQGVVKAGVVSSAHHFQRLRIFIEYSVGSQHARSGASRLSYRLRPLSIEDVQTYHKDQAVEPVDVSTMGPGSEISLQQFAPCFLRLDDTIVEVTLN